MKSIVHMSLDELYATKNKINCKLEEICLNFPDSDWLRAVKAEADVILKQIDKKGQLLLREQAVELWESFLQTGEQ